MRRATKIVTDPSSRMQVCGIVALIGTAMTQVWFDHPEIVRLGTFLSSVGASAGVLMARHRLVTDVQSGATTYQLRKQLNERLGGKKHEHHEPRHDQ
jgi:hypothetical protein